MEYKILDEKSYKLHTIRTDSFKLSKIEIVFQSKIDRLKSAKRSFLSYIMDEGNKMYPTRRDVSIELENFYKPYLGTTTSRTGDTISNIFTLNFINPELIEEENYLESLIKFFFSMILEPNVKNNAFDEKTFNFVKKNILLDIESVEENPRRKAIHSALSFLDSSSASSVNVLGTKEDIDKITPENLYEEYINMLKEDNIDIFVIGNTDIDKIATIIKANFENHYLKINKLNYFIENKQVKKPQKHIEPSTFGQSQLVNIYNLNNLTKKESEVTFHVLNFILGSGGISSKLYQSIREKNSYCYNISSSYLKYDNLLCISSSLAYKNVSHAIKLIHQAILEMQKGDFTVEQIEEAKKNLISSLKINRKNTNSILYNYQFKYYTESYSIDEKIEAVESVSKKEIMNLAKKIKENTIYVLKEVENEGN